MSSSAAIAIGSNGVLAVSTRRRRSGWQKLVDTATFPLRALTLFDVDKWGLHSLATERFDYVAREVRGFCLDVGCGKGNRFVQQFLGGNGRGIDIFPYEGLLPENLVADLTHFPFEDSAFETVTFIANLNHVPRSNRDSELAEARRCLKPGGNVIVTMGNPLAELIVHRVIFWHDKIFGTNYDVDTQRGMGDEEAYYLTDKEILQRLAAAGFQNISKKYFGTQWGLNHLFVGWKP